jgi:manganese transport system ATP-binding protein
MPSSASSPAATASAISVSRLSVRFGDVQALQDVTFEIPAGSLYGLLGPNGSGKSTLLKTLIGKVRPTSGTVELGNTPTPRSAPWLGYVPQASTADSTFPITVAEVVAMGLYGARPRLRLPFRTPPAVLEALEAVSLAHLRNRQVSELSGGQQRRVMIARALVRRPKVILLDEPAAGLDVGADERLTELLRSLADSGRTVVVATHDIEAVARHYDHAALLSTRCIASGPVAEVITDAHLHEAFGRQLLIFHGDTGHHHDIEGEQGELAKGSERQLAEGNVPRRPHHDVTFHRADHD